MKNIEKSNEIEEPVQVSAGGWGGGGNGVYLDSPNSKNQLSRQKNHQFSVSMIITQIINRTPTGTER